VQQQQQPPLQQDPHPQLQHALQLKEKQHAEAFGPAAPSRASAAAQANAYFFMARTLD
jgi:hypothetical protein